MDTRRATERPGRRPDGPVVGTETSSVELVDLQTVRNGGHRGSNAIIVVVALIITAVLFGVVIASPRLDVSSASPPPTSFSLATPTAGVAVATPRPTRPRATPTPTAPEPTPYPWEWRSVVVDAFISGVQIDQMWSLGDHYVALITERNQQVDTRASSLMVSTDGVNWARGLLPAPGFVVSGGAVAGGNLWVVGHVPSGDEPAYQMWWTTDVATWFSDGELEGFPTGEVDVAQMERGSSGWVAVVNQYPTDEFGPAGMWILASADGLAWKAAKRFAATTAKDSIGLATGGRVWLLLLEERGEGSTVEVTVLRSTDGLTWSTYPVATLDGFVSGITTGPGGFIIAGGEIDGGRVLPRIWRSPGGRAWTPKTVGMAAGRESVGITGIVTTDLGYLAFGQQAGETWLSYDGDSWRNVPIWHESGVGSIEGLTTRGNNIVAWGLGGEADATIFLGDLGCMLPAGC